MENDEPEGVKNREREGESLDADAHALSNYGTRAPRVDGREAARG